MSGERTGGLDKRIGPGLGGIALLALGMHLIVGTPFFAVFLCGIFACWALRGAWWAWIPAGIFGMDALDHSGVHLGGVGLPMLFILAGVLVVAHDHIWPPARKVGLIIIGLLMLSAIFNNDHRSERNVTRTMRRPAINSTSSSARPELTPPSAADLAGKTVIVQNGSGDVTLRSGYASAEGSRTSVRWTVAGQSVIVNASDGSKDVSLQLPDSVSAIVVKTGSGDVDAAGKWSALTVQTGSGDVDVALEGNPTVDITTGDGSIDLEGFGNAEPDDHRFHVDGPDGTVVITTGEGDIDVERKDKVLR